MKIQYKVIRHWDKITGESFHKNLEKAKKVAKDFSDYWKDFKGGYKAKRYFAEVKKLTPRDNIK